jgi:hypothetical protein
MSKELTNNETDMNIQQQLYNEIQRCPDCSLHRVY